MDFSLLAAPRHRIIALFTVGALASLGAVPSFSAHPGVTTGGVHAQQLAQAHSGPTRPVSSPASASHRRYLSPTTGKKAIAAPEVLKAFDKPEHNWLPGHRGVDLAAAPGSTIRAPQDGVVHFVGSVAGVPTLSIVHPDGVRTTYQPVESPLQRGESVLAGQEIGTLTQHPSQSPGLQWGAVMGGEYINPLSLVGVPRIVLKPLSG